MALKSVLDIDVRGFSKFAELYAKYERALRSQPAAWALINQKIDGTRKTFAKVVDGMVAANVQAKLLARAQEEADRRTRTTAERWREIARSTGAVASNLRSAASTLLRWGTITGIVGGLVGAGSLFGIDRLAGGVAAQRRASLGSGAGIGGASAFGANFGRLVSPDAFLGGVAGAKLDITRRVGLIGAGLSPSEIGADTAETAVSLLRRLKTIADTTAPALYAQIIQARRLEQFVSPEDLLRLRNTSGGEFGELVRRYSRNRGEFDLPPDVARKWQEFSTALDRAGKGIEVTFVRGLGPLTPALTKLSESFEGVIRAFLSSPALEKWIKGADEALEKFAGYIGTDEFLDKVRAFVEGIGKIAAAVVNAVSWVAGSDPDVSSQRSASVDRVTRLRADRAAGRNTVAGQLWDALTGNAAAGNNNPGNLRLPNSATGFQSFNSPEAGVRAIASQLLRYGDRDHLNTIDKIITKYAPPNENDTAAYIKDVTRRTGLGAGDALNLHDPGTLSRLVAAIVGHEQRGGRYDTYKDQKVVIELLNNTGGNTAVSVNALK